jgi:hypothetical protein
MDTILKIVNAASMVEYMDHDRAKAVANIRAIITMGEKEGESDHAILDSIADVLDRFVAASKMAR